MKHTKYPQIVYSYDQFKISTYASHKSNLSSCFFSVISNHLPELLALTSPYVNAPPKSSKPRTPTKSTLQSRPTKKLILSPRNSPNPSTEKTKHPPVFIARTSQAITIPRSEKKREPGTSMRSAPKQSQPRSIRKREPARKKRQTRGGGEDAAAPAAPLMNPSLFGSRGGGDSLGPAKETAPRPGRPPRRGGGAE